ncbi:Tfp pilus assembly protein FimV [Skermanella aerolata]|uniref:hypothetical protein n=1 Tax=Skermanella aerolata TaxID=393310 RepID=UPI003D1A181B
MRTYDKNRLIALQDAKAASHAAVKSAEARQSEARSSKVGAEQYVATLMRHSNNTPAHQLAAAEAALADAVDTLSRRTAALNAAADRWASLARVVANCEEFIRDNRLTAA